MFVCVPGIAYLLLLNDGRVVQLLTLCRRGKDAEVLDIASSKDDAIVDEVVRGHFLAWIFLTPFTSHALHMLKRNSG